MSFPGVNGKQDNQYKMLKGEDEASEAVLPSRPSIMHKLLKVLFLGFVGTCLIFALCGPCHHDHHDHHNHHDYHHDHGHDDVDYVENESHFDGNRDHFTWFGLRGGHDSEDHLGYHHSHHHIQPFDLRDPPPPPPPHLDKMFGPLRGPPHGHPRERHYAPPHFHGPPHFDSSDSNDSSDSSDSTDSSYSSDSSDSSYRGSHKNSQNTAAASLRTNFKKLQSHLPLQKDMGDNLESSFMHSPPEGYEIVESLTGITSTLDMNEEVSNMNLSELDDDGKGTMYRFSSSNEENEIVDVEGLSEVSPMLVREAMESFDHP
jgi:hypothetical protein